MPDTKETFPRAPSNEQTLLTELGEAKRRLAAAQFHIDIVTASRDALQAERDGLAVANERQRLALLRIARLSHSLLDVLAGDIRRIVADALLCTVEELEAKE